MDLNGINNLVNWLDSLIPTVSTFCNYSVSQNEINAVKNDLIIISQNIQKIYPSVSCEIFGLKDTLFDGAGCVNPITLGALIALLRFLLNDQMNDDFWNMIHPLITRTSKALFLDGHYANAAEDAFVEINFRVKEIFKLIHPDNPKIPDGVEAMNKMFSANNPIIKLGDLSTETGRNLQQGYMNLFSGAMSALRNPKAHENIDLSKEECKKRLVFASMLMDRLDEGVRETGVEET